MSNNIAAISFDKHTFRHSPTAHHEYVKQGGGLTFFVYDDANTPTRKENTFQLDDVFSAAAHHAPPKSILFVRLSGLKADPNIDFILNGETVSVRAVDYLLGFSQYVEKLPQEALEAHKQDPTALHDYEKEWSVQYFREKLGGVLDGTDEFFMLVYRGLDNSMGDFQRSLIVYSMHDPNKAAHGSFDLPEQRVVGSDHDKI